MLAGLTGLCAIGPGSEAVSGQVDPPRAEVTELPLASDQEVQRLCFSPDNRSLVAAVRDAQQAVSLHRWDLRTRKRREVASIGPYAQVRNLTWSRGNRELVVAAGDWVGWFDPESGTLRAELSTKTPRHGGLRYEEWNGSELKKCAHFGTGNFGNPITLAGNVAVLVDYQKRELPLITFGERGPGQVIKLPAEAEAFQYNLLAVSADGSTVAGSQCALDPGIPVRIWAWSARTGALAREIAYRPQNSAVTLDHLLTLNRNGSLLAAAPDTVCPVTYVIDLRQGRVLHECHTGGIQSLAASPGSDVFACITGKGVAVWSMTNGKRLAAFGDDGKDCQALAFSPDGSQLAWGWKTIRLARVPTQK
jgi:WD40 repeat protein